MTRLAASIMVHTLEQAHASAAKAAERGADLVEYRIDHFTEHPNQVTQLVEESPLPCIVTCRPTWEGGEYDGEDQARISLLEHASLGQRLPAYLDVELVTYQRSANLRQKVGLAVDHPGQVRPITTGLILSSHDFTSRPADLYQRIEAMVAAPACRVIKLAWRARSIRDNLEAFQIILDRHKPTIALCMGEEGLMSRVLAKKFGALLTFAAIDGESTTAPGQPTLDEIKRLYRWDTLNPETRVYGVIGHPVGHSMSPAIHNRGFDEVDYDGVYLPMPILPAYEAFKATVLSMLDMGPLHFRGASVTIPHKENLLQLVKEEGGEIEPLAQTIGAANTLTVRDDGSLYASNTDYDAALDSVCVGMGIERDALADKRVAVIGAGGAARAIVAGFAHYGATVVVYNRTLEKAQALAEEMSRQPTSKGQIVAARLDKLCDSCCHIIINCTPLGMHPDVEGTPLPAESFAGKKRAWGPETLVFDTVYNPIETRLLREAKEAGCKTVPGTEMFVRQAAAQFKLWTGKDAPLDAFRQVLEQRLKK